MSKVYEAQQRLERERAEDRAGKQEFRRSGGWWKGALVGCVFGLAVGTILRDSISTRPPLAQPPAPPVAAVAPPCPPELLATAAVGVEEAPAESYPAAAAPAGGPMAIQVGAFRNNENSARLAARLRAEGYQVMIEPSRAGHELWVVRVRGYPDRHAAEAARTALERLGVSGLLVRTSLERAFDDASRHARAQEGR